MFYFTGKPDSPCKPTVSDIKATEIRVSWNPPEFDGGSLITGYLVEYKEVTSTKWERVTLNKYTDTFIVVSDLREKTQYQFRVSAENQIGLGTCSQTSDLCTTLGM